MLKTSLIILYAVPISLAVFWIYKYYATASVNSFYKENVKQVDAKVSSVTDTVNKMRLPADDIDRSEKLYADYRMVSAVGQTSWTTLLGRLEKLAPPEMRFKSISIKPDRLVRIRIEGETVHLKHLTGFLQALFTEKVFSSPNLRNHNRIVSEGVEVIAFNLEVDYAGEKGELP